MLKAVILDASANARSSLRAILAGSGHDIVGESSVASSVPSKLVNLAPQLIFISLDDVDADPWSTVETLRTLLPKALIFGISTSFTAAMLERATEQGVHGFIVKPFNGGKVQSAIRSAVLRLVRAQATP